MKEIIRIKKGEEFTMPLGQCYFIKKKATENGYLLKSGYNGMCFFFSDSELKSARKIKNDPKEI
jgi:hypothetical protein